MIGYPLGLAKGPCRKVWVGSVALGGGEPPVLQSMITASAVQLAQAVAQIQELDQVGCQLIRLSIPSKKELDAIPALRLELERLGINRPLVADVHFSPALAILSCQWFEKVRINPGNFSDSPKNSGSAPIDPAAFEAGRLRQKEALAPLAQELLKYDRAVRVGVNQGSLSERMMNRYGDSPLGMVHSALETVDLLEELGVQKIVISLKSSNPLVVQKAYRLLAQLRAPKEPLPLHLGVTEAGDGVMGRAKSLAGVGPLLYDGLGETLRVSLTEPCKNEIAYGRTLLDSLAVRETLAPEKPKRWFRELDHRRVHNQTGVGLTGLELPLGQGAPVLLLGLRPAVEYSGLETNGWLEFKEGKLVGFEGTVWPQITDPAQVLPPAPGLVLDLEQPLLPLRELYSRLGQAPAPLGLWVKPHHLHSPLAQTELAALLGEGLVDFLLLDSGLSLEDQLWVTHLLQATRTRISLTDYIACPSCSRTLFDLESTTARIKAKTGHLKGLKLGIMGCIVNGPGEMADADFGYVGSGPGKVDLYRGQERVERNLPEAQAVEALLELIQKSGSWREP